jgi:DNA primase catalytic core
MMARDGPAAAEHRPEQDGDREQRLTSLRIRLEQAAGEVRAAEDWARCLRAAARLRNESWANVLLIAVQRPNATTVRGYEAWRAAGRQVNRGENAIEIFSQARHRDGPDDDEHDYNWRDADRVAYVWDLSQTSGQALPAPAAIPSPGETPPALWACLCWLARREGFAVERERGCPADGTTLWAARRIRVLADLANDQAAWALAHQLGHVLLHNAVAHPPGATTSGCQGMRKAEADSVAFVIFVRYGVEVEHTFSSPRIWAGSDPRAQPAATVLAVGERITRAATRISRLLDHYLSDVGLAAAAEAETTAVASENDAGTRPAAHLITEPADAPASPPEPGPRISRVLHDAEEFYADRLAKSWVPAYLRKRGISAAAMGEWHIGYAPRGWTTLTDHLRRRGHEDDAIQAAGLARISSRGTLIDHFRDRVMLPVHDEHGRLAGFIGRAWPGADPSVPKYLNSPETSTYKKGDLLFGLHHARNHLARGARPVLVEGPFDAIAVTLADPSRYAGLAPCGTALTSRQAAALARVGHLERTGILVAFDDDAAGRKAAIRAYGTLRAVSDRLQSVVLSGKDPAEVLETEGAAALRAILRGQVRPLSGVVIGAHLDQWERKLQDAAGPLLAMRSAAIIIADLLPIDTARTIRQITADKELMTLDEDMNPVVNAELLEIARAIPADAAYQTIQVAERLGFTEYSDILAEVANAVIRKAVRPDSRPRDGPLDLARSSFPYPPLPPNRAEPAVDRVGRPANFPKREPARGSRR